MTMSNARLDRTIIAMDVHDVRFPDVAQHRRLDAMNPDPDYSAAYVVLHTEQPTGSRGTASRSRSAAATSCASRRQALAPLVVGMTLDDITADMGALLATRRRRSAAALGWPGEGRASTSRRRPSSTRSGISGRRRKASRSGSCSRDMTPEELVRCIDFRYITDAITPARGDGDCCARNARHARCARGRDACATAIPPTRPRPAGSATPTTRCAACAARRSPTGWTHFKIKVGRDLDGRHPPRRASCARRSAPIAS